MPRLSALLTRIAWCGSALFVLCPPLSWAQSPPTLPPSHDASPEFRARLDAAAADAAIQPWQRDFMRGLSGSDAAAGTAGRGADPILDVGETGEWDQLPPPLQRSSLTAIYDPVRDRMIIFGGLYSRSDVWELRLSGKPTWSELRPTGTLPAGRTGHSAIYDPVRDRVVIFGGYDGSVRRNDVWALDLAGTLAWAELSPTDALPLARSGHSAIYDPLRDRMVVFGGYFGNGNSSHDLWALALAGTPAWSELSPSGILSSARSNHSAIYDSGRDRMVIFGGWEEGSGLRYNDVWAVRLADTLEWSELSPTGAAPSPRFGHTAIYDPPGNRMVVFAGYAVLGGGSSSRNDVWALSLADTSAWSAISPTGTLPAARNGHTSTYDPMRERMVVFGGSSGTTPRNDLWALGLAGAPQWSELGRASPASRTRHTSTYDSQRGQMVVFGGAGTGGPLNDVWALGLSDPPAWSALSPTGALPALRQGHSAIYDPVRDRVVVFGGVGSSNPFNDVRVLGLSDTPAWSALSPTGALPGGRAGHNAIYDPVRERMIVFGGLSGASDFNDVWALSLAGTPAWTVLSPTGTLPPARTDATAIYDPVRDRMIVFGGYGSADSFLNDVWALSLAGTPAWSDLSPSGATPIARSTHTAVYDPVRDRMVMFGGYAAGNIHRNDVWALRLDGAPEWSELAPTGALPNPRFDHSAIYDPVRDDMIVFAGSSPLGRNDVWRLNWSSLVAVDPAVPSPSRQFEFAPPRPTPSRGSVSFDITVPHASPVSLRVYDSSGRIVRRIADAPFAPGRHVLVWDRRNGEGHALPSGIYFVRLHAPGALLTRKAILIQ